MRIKVTVFLWIIISCAFAQKNYTAGEVQSKETTYHYGRYEMMMYSSDVSGTTSTFFLWKDAGYEANVYWNELDIETFGKSANEWQSNPIWEYDNNDALTKRWEETHDAIPIAKTWVKFTLEWTPGYIAWFNNDIEVRRIVLGENVPIDHFRYNNGDSDDPVQYIRDPMRICFNHWATYPGEWLGPWNDAGLPSYQFVDWLTYQEWNGTGFNAVSIRQDFDSYNEITDFYNISTHTFDENQCDFSVNAVGVTNGYMWLGIFNRGQERAPVGDEIPAGGPTPPISVHQVPGIVPAEEYANMAGLQLENVVATEGTGQNLGYTEVGDYVEYAIDVATAGNYSVDFRVASLNGGAGFSVSLDGAIAIPNSTVDATGGWQVWETITENILLPQGEHTVRIDVTAAGFNLYKISFSEIVTITQTIDLEQGWNLISTNIHPTDSTIETIFNGLDVSLVKDANGFWRQGQASVFNSLQTITTGNGYVVYMNSAGTISIAGTPVDVNYNINRTGWQLIGCKPETTTPFSTQFDETNCQTIKNFDGFWIPNETLNSIEYFEPGKGYYVFIK